MANRRFKFKLEPVLNLRKTREEAALRALADMQRSHQQTVAERKELDRQLQQALVRREEFGGRSSPIVVFGLEQDFIDGTKQRIVRQDQAVIRSMRGVEKALRAFLLARRQTRAMEVLREKAFADHKKEVLRREQRELDDLSIMRARFNENARESEGAA